MIRKYLAFLHFQRSYGVLFAIFGNILQETDFIFRHKSEGLVNGSLLALIILVTEKERITNNGYQEKNVSS